MTRVLYIGGTGEISLACVEQAVAAGHHVSVFNRGNHTALLPEAVEVINGDLGDESSYLKLAKRKFDVVCQFLMFNPDAMQRDIEIFANQCEQYIFISSASAYEKPCRDPIITEATPLANPYWAYARKKAACEALLAKANASGTLAATIVRPSHTYRTRLPGTVIDGDHQAWRILQGKPVIVHGDGQSLWTLTHSADFARAFVRLCGNPKALGETFHITDSRAHTWDLILQLTADILGREAKILHVPTDNLVRYNADWSGPLRGDKSNSVVFDNAHIDVTVGGWQCEIPLREGLRLASMHVSKRLSSGYKPDPVIDELVDKILAEF